MQKLPTKGIHHNLMSFFLWSTKMKVNQANQVIIKSAAKNFEIGVENHSLAKSDKFSPFTSNHGTKIVNGMIVPSTENPMSNFFIMRHPLQ